MKGARVLGMCSLHGRCRRPSGGYQRYLAGVPLDFKEQADFMQAVFENYAAKTYRRLADLAK